MNKETIIIDGLTKQFKNTLAVKNISFKINKGKIVGLLGPNGCGKSTTIGMMLGLIKPSSGTVIINGQNIEHNRANLLEKMNFISPYVELPKKLTVEENLKVYGRLYGVKNLKHNLRIMSKISTFHSLGCPILIGTSRKRFIEHIVTKFDTQDRTGGTLASVLYGLLQGVQLFREIGRASCRERV